LRTLSFEPDTEALERFGKRFRFQDHAFAAAERAIVHSAVAVVSELAQIEDANRDKGIGLGAAHDAVLEKARKESREDGENVEAHGYTELMIEGACDCREIRACGRLRQHTAHLMLLWSNTRSKVCPTQMPDIESLITRWQSAGILDAAAADRIRGWEAGQKRPTGLRWQGVVALILGAILLASGVVLFVSAHWDELGPGARFTLVLAMVGVFHTAGAATRASYRAMSTALHAVGTAATGAAIALVGQIFNIQEHWPAAILLWALAALAGWVLLHDEAQQTITLLLGPAWLFSELEYATEQHIGQDVYLGRFLFVWSVLYLTAFLGSKCRAVQGILFAAAAIASVTGVVFMLASWVSWGEMVAIPLHVRVWAWVAFAALPLFFALFRFGKSMIPVAAACVFCALLPWCNRTWETQMQWGNGKSRPYTQSEPNLLAYALVAAFSIFIIGWGVRQLSRALVNLGIVGFAITVVWFFFSNIFDKVGRSLGLIAMGILFLVGGWGLEKMRRRLIAGMTEAGKAKP